MSVFSDVFDDGMSYLAEASGEGVTVVMNGKKTPCTAIVGNERARLNDVQNGLENRREREFTFQLSQIDPPIDSLIVYLKEDWTVVGVANRSASAVRLLCTRPMLHEGTRQNFRGGR